MQCRLPTQGPREAWLSEGSLSGGLQTKVCTPSKGLQGHRPDNPPCQISGTYSLVIINPSLFGTSVPLIKVEDCQDTFRRNDWHCLKKKKKSMFKKKDKVLLQEITTPLAYSGCEIMLLAMRLGSLLLSQ